MNDWSSGYVTDIGYTFGYYAELNPLRARLAFLSKGIAYPTVETACELGFGQGVSVNMHAAASPVRWYANDFNPAQVGFARELASASGIVAELSEEAFNEFCSRDDLPNFDFIGLHGIWSWIAERDRNVIIDFLRRKLRPGGILYLSYNCYPGRAPMVPVQNLMRLYASIMGTRNEGVAGKIRNAVDFMNEFASVNPAFLRACPGVLEQLKKMTEQNPEYLAHEYFNENWYNPDFATVSSTLTAAKLEYAASAFYMDHVEKLNHTSEQLAFLQNITDTALRQTVGDFMINQQFRRDYWVKGARKLSRIEQIEQISQQRVVLVNGHENIELTVKGALGDADMSKKVYEPVINYLVSSGTATIGEIFQAVKNSDVNLGQLVQAIMVLCHKGDVAPANSEETAAQVSDACKKLNDKLMEKAKRGQEVNWLVSPVTGGGLRMSRFEQLFTLAIQNGMQEPNEWVNFVLQNLKELGQKLAKEGKPVNSEEESENELKKRAESFNKTKLAALREAKIVS